MSFFCYHNASGVGGTESSPTDPVTIESLKAPPRSVAKVSPNPAAVKSATAVPEERVSMVGGVWDPLRIYVREAVVTPLLTRDEEDAVARQVMQGNPEARERMILSNLRLVIKLAKEFEGYGLPLLDMINLGNIGLMKAVDRFDPDKGAKFSTYAVWWIRQSILRGLSDQSRTIRVPAYQVQAIARLKRTMKELEATLGREVSIPEIAEEADLPVGRVRQLLSIDIGTISLDAPMSAHNDESVQSTVADDESKIPSALSARADLRRHARQYLDKLTEKEKAILSRRFGLEGKDPETLEDIGADYHVTRERIRQIEARALLKLRKLIAR